LIEKAPGMAGDVTLCPAQSKTGLGGAPEVPEGGKIIFSFREERTKGGRIDPRIIRAGVFVFQVDLSGRVSFPDRGPPPRDILGNIKTQVLLGGSESGGLGVEGFSGVRLLATVNGLFPFLPPEGFSLVLGGFPE
jgi:hypothetical protein